MSDASSAETVGRPPATPPPPASPAADDLLRQILHELKIINHRERWRTASGFLHTIITFAPLILFLYGMWFAYSSADNIIDQIVDRAVSTFMHKGLSGNQASSSAPPANWQDMIKNFLPNPGGNR